MKRKTIFCLLFLIIFFSLAFSQNYYFEIPSYDVDVYIQKDASIDIYYEIVFKPVSGYHAIDIVDIGFPNEFYSRSSVRAKINGKDIPLSQIKKSAYIPIGVEIHLYSDQILPGKQGTLWVYGNNPNMVHQDSEKEDYASVVFAPTWFGSQYVRGTTKLSIRIHFPPGVQPDETVYHKNQYTHTYIDADGRRVFSWNYNTASMTSAITVGAVSYTHLTLPTKRIV